MSLFKAKEWWSSGDILDEDTASLLGGCLKLAQLGPEGSGDMIVFGAPHSIQIFRPQGSYRPTDVVLEHLIEDHPVLQIECGKLMPGTNVEHIAVLHPHLLTVYGLSSKEGHTDYGDQNILFPQYRHTFIRSAYCFIVGPFGGIKNKDFICVQSLDGMLSFYEQDVAAFTCYLPEVLIPGPLGYSCCADIFITCNSNWTVEAYSYYSLSHISDSEKGPSTKKLAPNWIYNVGENIISIHTIQTVNTSCCFIMLGEKFVYCLRDTGVLQFMKKFDFEPVCCYAYLIGWYYENNARLMIMVVSDTSTLYIYEETTLLWSCQLTFMPILITRGFFPSLPGSLVLLTDYGEIKCCYLGTEPELFTAPPLPSNETDFEKAQEELERLQKIIDNQHNISEINVVNATANKEMPFSIHISDNLETNDYFISGESEHFEKTKSFKCKAQVKLKPMNKREIDFLQITFVTQHPLECSNQTEYLTSILTDEVTVETYVFVSEMLPVSSLKINVIVLFSTAGNIRVLEKEERLPFNLVCCPIQPLKECKYKVTLEIDQNLDLLDLFKEFHAEDLSNAGSTSNVIAFSSINNSNDTVTIVAAKSSNRYRLQCNKISILGIVFDELIHRVGLHSEKKAQLLKEETKKIVGLGEISSDIMRSFLKTIDRHVVLRQNLLQAENELEILSAQFILIQKKLMVKYRERAPASCEGIGFLLQETHSRIGEKANEIQKFRHQVKECACELSSVIELVLMIFNVADINKNELECVRSALLHKNLQDDNQNWEENVARNVVNLLQTTFIKTEKERDKILRFNTEESFLLFDSKRLIKYVNMILENVQGKSVKSQEAHDFPADEEKIKMNETESNKDDSVFKVPEGSSYGHRLPILTARLEKQQKYV